MRAPDRGEEWLCPTKRLTKLAAWFLQGPIMIQYFPVHGCQRSTLWLWEWMLSFNGCFTIYVCSHPIAITEGIYHTKPYHYIMGVNGYAPRLSPLLGILSIWNGIAEAHQSPLCVANMSSSPSPTWFIFGPGSYGAWSSQELSVNHWNPPRTVGFSQPKRREKLFFSIECSFLGGRRHWGAKQLLLQYMI